MRTDEGRVRIRPGPPQCSFEVLELVAHAETDDARVENRDHLVERRGRRLVVRTVVTTPEFSDVEDVEHAVNLPNLPKLNDLSRRKSRIADPGIAVRVIGSTRIARVPSPGNVTLMVRRVVESALDLPRSRETHLIRQHVAADDLVVPQRDGSKPLSPNRRSNGR